MKAGALVVGVGERLQPGDQLFAQRRQFARDLLVGETSPLLPLRIFLGPVAGERGILLVEDAIYPFQKHLVIAGQMRQVLVRRPFSRGRRLQDRLDHATMERKVKKAAELALTALQSRRVGCVHDSVWHKSRQFHHGDTEARRRSILLRVSVPPWWVFF